MAGFLEGLKNLFKKPIVPALAIGALGFGLGALVGKKRAQNNSIFGFGFDSKGNYDGYIGSGRLRGLYHGPHGHHGHHDYRNKLGRYYNEFKEFEMFKKFQNWQSGGRYNHCSMHEVQRRPYDMSKSCNKKQEGLTISTGDDGNIYIGGDLSGKKVTIYG